MVKALSLDGPVQADGGLAGWIARYPADPDDDAATRRSACRRVATSSTLTANGIGVAIIDSGITPSADFNGRISGFYDFTNGRGGLSVTPYDDYGHGTHIAG